MSELDLAELVLPAGTVPNFIRVSNTQYAIAFGAHHDGTNWVGEALGFALITVWDLATIEVRSYLDAVMPGGVFTPTLWSKFFASWLTLSAPTPAAAVRRVDFSTNGSIRWAIEASTGAESGGNVGSDFRLVSYSDAGAALRTVFQITRAGVVTASPTQWLAGGSFYPPLPTGLTQLASGLRAGSGAPNNADGLNGDYYFRSDGGVGTHIYFKSAGAWAGLI